MFRMFSRRSREPPTQTPSRRQRRRDQVDAALTSTNEFNAGREVNQEAERELYKFDAPQQTLGMSDLIKSHEAGDRFLYAAISGHPSESRDSRLRRLIQYQPALNKKVMPLEKLPAISLFQEVENFPMDSIIRPGRNNERPYVRIADAVVVYGSLISYDAAFTKIKISIVDNRLLQGKTSKSMTATSNITCKANLALSYCFPKAEASHISLAVSRENNFLEEGIQWGVLRIQLVLEELDFPYQTDNDPVVATNSVPKTLLEDRSVDPDHVDISISNIDRKKLADMYMEGDIADGSEPIVNKTSAVRYAKSSLAGPKGKRSTSVSGDWSFMSQKRIGQVDADQNSVDIEEEGSLRSGSDLDDRLEEARRWEGQDSSLSFRPQRSSSPQHHEPPSKDVVPIRSALRKVSPSESESTNETIEIVRKDVDTQNAYVFN